MDAEKISAETYVHSHQVAAPREFVFEAWTNPQHFNQWFSPKGFKSEFLKQDIRVGGVTHYRMTSPDGLEVWGKAIYKEIIKPSKFVYKQQFSNREGTLGYHPLAPTFPRQMLTTILFHEAGSHTQMELHWNPVDATQQELDTFVAAKPSLSQGWAGTFENLDNYLKQLQKNVY